MKSAELRYLDVALLESLSKYIGITTFWYRKVNLIIEATHAILERLSKDLADILRFSAKGSTSPSTKNESVDLRLLQNRRNKDRIDGVVHEHHIINVVCKV